MQPVEDEIYASVVDSIPSLNGKCFAITGCTSGTGFWTAVAAVRKGAACVIMLNRPSARAASALEKVQAEQAAPGTTEVVHVDCDLQSLASVRAAAASVNSIAGSFGGLHALINNAGIMAQPDSRTADGFDIQMQTNHLSHFLLSKLTFPSVAQAAKTCGDARLVQHSSAARNGTRSMGELRGQPWEDVPIAKRFMERSERGSLGGDEPPACFNRYHQTKLANTVFMMGLHERLANAGLEKQVKSLVAEPGVASTDLGKNLFQAHKSNDHADSSAPFAQMFAGMKGSGGKTVQSAADGACPIILASFAADAASGDFYMPSVDRQGFCVGPPVKTLRAGAPAEDAPEWIRTKFAQEQLTIEPSNRNVLWAASEAAVDEEFVIAA